MMWANPHHLHGSCFSGIIKVAHSLVQSVARVERVGYLASPFKIWFSHAILSDKSSTANNHAIPHCAIHGSTVCDSIASTPASLLPYLQTARSHDRA